jgi:transcriptional regulator with XRE-family HTH domain
MASHDQPDTLFQSYVASRIRDARLTRHLTQEELAERARIDQAQVSNLEKGRVSPKMSTFYRITQALDLSPANFFAEFLNQRTQDAKKKEARAEGDGEDDIDFFARQIAERMHTAVIKNEKDKEIWDEYFDSKGKKTALLARLLIRVFFQQRWRDFVGRFDQLDDHQKYVIGEMVGFLLPDSQPGVFSTTKEKQRSYRSLKSRAQLS